MRKKRYGLVKVGAFWVVLLHLSGYRYMALGAPIKNDPREEVPQTFAQFGDYRICSGPLSDEWVDGESGQRIKMEWQRSFEFEYDQKDTKEGRFAIFYSYHRQIQFYTLEQTGSLEKSWVRSGPLMDYEGGTELVFQWNESLERYVGWSEGGNAGETYPNEIFLTVNGVTLENGGLRIRYSEFFPLQHIEKLQMNLGFYDEFLSIVDQRLESAWTFDIWSAEPQTYRPLKKISVESGQRVDRLEKCSLGF